MCYINKLNIIIVIPKEYYIFILPVLPLFPHTVPVCACSELYLSFHTQRKAVKRYCQ